MALSDEEKKEIKLMIVGELKAVNSEVYEHIEKTQTDDTIRHNSNQIFLVIQNHLTKRY